MRFAAAVGACLIVAALLAVLLQRDSRLAYDNGKPVKTPAVVPPGASFCQSNEYVPAGAERLRMWVSTAGEPGSPFDVELRRGGRVISRGTQPGGYIDRAVDVPLRPAAVAGPGADICVENGGPRRIGVMGAKAGPNEAPARAGKVAQPQVTREGETTARGADLLGEPTVVRLEWHRPGEESWLELAPTIASRAGLVKASFIGTWGMWVALTLVLAAGAAGVVLTLREGRR